MDKIFLYRILLEAETLQGKEAIHIHEKSERYNTSLHRVFQRL